MQSEEIDKLANHYKGGFAEYIYIYQTAVLAILTTLIAWGIAGLGVFDYRWPTVSATIAYPMVKTILFTLCSLTVRECWQVVDGTHRLLLIRREIKKALMNKGEGE